MNSSSFSNNQPAVAVEGKKNMEQYVNSLPYPLGLQLAFLHY